MDGDDAAQEDGLSDAGAAPKKAAPDAPPSKASKAAKAAPAKRKSLTKAEVLDVINTTCDSASASAIDIARMYARSCQESTSPEVCKRVPHNTSATGGCLTVRRAGC